ncbi:kinase domain protein (macronuclear) [Tetrahymena thermophila SB210]|uniref:Kinase domain protein n=1 Tax=Tetrahymena thermophila (strain SB210) TaxID=312017 RepID=Q22UX7_TETTS|nr:kinase domain protein [Tetrahymena thermophila SB210]EAR89171.1 kinase domain protein [Tetrahymena thermophila SB210]|eukprot:XP_001009416.1 kinase domain protein [Tetrahymena thermophila SB210]
MIKKINLKSKNLILNISEPDWRKMFEVYLNQDMMKHFVKDEEIEANRKAIQKKLTPARKPPTKYHLIHEKPPLCQFYYFIRGLYFECGIPNILRPDPIKAYEIFLQGFEENQDSLCAYKIAATQCNPKNRCRVKVDKQKALFFLVMSAILIDIQYEGNSLDIRQQMFNVIQVYEEGYKLSDILIQRYGGAYFSNEMKRVYSLMFDYQFCENKLHGQEKYDTLLIALQNQIKIFGDQFCLIYLFQTLIQKNVNISKNLKLFIDVCISGKKEAYRAALNLLLKEFDLLSKAQRDHFFFFNKREVFYEMYNFLKFFGGPEKSELIQQVFQVNEFLFEKQFFILQSSLHYSQTMRIRSKIYEKGLGGIPINLTLALESINKELSMPKQNENSYAYANYVAAKLKRKLNYQYTDQQVNEHFQKSYNQFTSRLQSQQNQKTANIVCLYYLARISKLWSKNFLDTKKFYLEALNLYLNNKITNNNVTTLQYEILCIKIEKKTNSQGQASLYYGHGIQSPQAQQQLQSQSQMINNNNNPQNLGQSNINGFNQNPQQQMNQSQLNQMNGSKINGLEQMQQSNLNGIQNSQNGFYQQNNGQNSSQLGNQQNSQNLYQSQLNNNMNQSNINNPNNLQSNFNGNNNFNNQSNYQNNQNNLPSNMHASFNNQNNNMNGSVINTNPNNYNAQNNANNSNIFMNNQGNNYQSGINNRNIQAQQSSSMNHSLPNTAHGQQQQQQINQSSPPQQVQFQPQISGGVNYMNASNNIKASNALPYENQQNNLQNSNILAQQLLGSSSNPNSQDRQNYFEAQQGNQQFNTNRSQNVNYQQQHSPNINKSNSQQPIFNYNNNENAGLSQQQLQTNPNNIDYVGLNYQGDIKTFQTQQNENFPKNSMNQRNQNGSQPFQNNSANGNIFQQNQFKTMNGSAEQLSPYKKSQPNQSIFGNNIQSKYLSFGFSNFNISKPIQDKINQLMIKRTFFDPKDVIILDFLHRGSNYTTSEAVILNRNPVPQQSQSLHSIKNMDINMISADKLSKFRSYKKHMNISPEDQLILDGEPVVVKQFLISNPREVDEMFYFIESQEKKLMNQSSSINNQSTNVNSLAYQQHLAQVFLGQSLIYIKGFSYQPVSNDAISLYLFYPAQSYNLYGAMRKNLFSLLDKLLIASYICDSLQNLHASSIFHLNLKPSNILFDSKKHPYLSGWEIRKKEKIQQAEENIDDDEQDDKYQVSYGYTPPEVVNSINTQKPQVAMANNFSTPQKSQLASYATNSNPSFGPLNTVQALSQFGPNSDVWSLGMIFHYLFFRIDSGEGNFCRDKRVYAGFNLIITEYAIGSNYFLDKIKELIEDMVKSNPDQRATLSHVKDLLQKLYIELDTQIKQDYSPSRSQYSSMKTSNTGYQSNYNSVNNQCNNYNNQASTHYSYNNNNGMHGTPQMQLGKQISGINRSNYSPNRYDMNNHDPFYNNGGSYNHFKSNVDPFVLNNNNNNYYDSAFNYNSTSPMRNHPSQPFFSQKNFSTAFQH